MDKNALTREDLFDLVWSKPMTQLAMEFGISDVGLAKACKRYNIPRPPVGYWAKLAVGKAPRRPALAPAQDENVTFSITPEEPAASPEVQTWVNREHDPANTIIVPSAVRHYHRLVRSTKEQLESHSENQHGLRWSREPGLRLAVGKANIGRACRILHTLFTNIEQRGGSVQLSPYHAATMHFLGEELNLDVHERSTRRPHELTPAEERKKRRGEYVYVPPYDFTPSGVLRFTVSHRATNRHFADHDNRPLEEQINAIIISMAELAIDVARPMSREDEERQRRYEEAQREQQAFRERCDRFEAGFRAWSEQQERIAFFKVLEAALTKIDGTDAMREYVAWTRRYVESAQPLERFFDALRRNEPAQYQHFATETRRW